MEQNLGSLLAQVSRLLRRNFDELARGVGVTRPQWQVLTLLQNHAGSNQGTLAELLEVEPITLGRMIDRLQDAGMVERRADPADRRAWRIYLTDVGAAQLDKLMPFARRTIDAAFDGLTPEEQDQLMCTLMKVRTNLSRKPQIDMVSNG
jgi:DNA-binding MarR family transcriptional regulator